MEGAKRLIHSLRTSLLGTRSNGEGQPTPELVGPVNKVDVFIALIKNIKWHESDKRAGYNERALENWKLKHEWKLLDEKLELQEMGKFIRRFTETNEVDIDLSSVKMRHIPTWYEDMYGVAAIEGEEEEEYHDSREEQEDIKPNLESTGVEPPAEHAIPGSIPPIIARQEINSQNDVGMKELAQLLQMSNGVLPNIEPLKTAKDDAKEWFEHFDMITNGYGWSDKIKGLKLPIFLKKDAQRIYKRLSEGERSNYALMKMTICAELMEEERSMMRAFHLNISQNQGESPADYGHRLKKFITKIDIPLKTADLITQFIQGLRPELRLGVMNSGSKTLEEAIRFAQKATHILCDTRTEEINSVSKSGQTSYATKKEPYKKNSIVCYHCGEGGHTKADCKIYKKALSVMTCKACNRKGHIARNCRVPTNGKAPVPRDQDRCQQ